MPDGSETICILGAGLAGVSAAGSFRDNGFTGIVILVGDEADNPYDRPPLSKEALAGEVDDSQIALHPAEWYVENQIELILNDGANQIARAEKKLTLTSGREVEYDRLLITTGAAARTMPPVSDDATPTHVIRTAADMRALRSVLNPGARLVIIGAGVIGLEAAATATKRECDVTVLEISDRAMARIVPPEISRHLEAAHRDHGVKLHFNAGEIAIETGAVTSSIHGRFDADAIVVGIGVLPNDLIAEDAGIECDNGILVDEFCRTSDPAIFAAGDVARYPCGFLGNTVRCENWRHAQLHGECAAKNMLGIEKPYDAAPTMWSDQYDIKMQTCGQLDVGAPILRGDVAAGKFIQFYCSDDGILVGAIGVNNPKDMKFAQMLIEKRAAPSIAALRDPSANLRKLG